MASFESELNAIVKEYLKYYNFEKTVTAFDDECSEFGKPVPNTSTLVRSNSALHNAQRGILTAFKSGEREEFFRLWNDHLSDKVRSEDSVGQKLEFYLHIYFAIHPVKHDPENKTECTEAMQAFRNYLETRGASLSQTTEFLPFYALPYVPNPRTHPSYKELFNEHWVPDLELRLNRYLQLVLDSVAQPRLFELYKGAQQKDNMTIQKLQAQALENERRAQQYMRRHNRVQADYHNLIGIAAELVDTLEASLQGKTVSPEYLQRICTRLFSSQQVNQNSIDFSRPGSAAQALRQSIKETRPVHSPKSQTRLNLDFQKIKTDIQSADNRRKALLLQALRWRLTRVGKDERDINLAAFVSNDIFGSTGRDEFHDSVAKILVSEDSVLRETCARLFNSISSLCKGRSYLSQDKDIVTTLFEDLKLDDSQGLTRENVIGVLQKLSLRRPMQTAMIQSGLIEWLIDTLEDNDNLSDYTLEYSVALLMNLCLRTSGKRKCIEIASKVLKVLSNLLGHENKEIFPYVNGALYSILAVPSIREEAKEMEMEDILKCFIKEDQPDMNRQLDFIIRQLNSTEEPPNAESDDEEDDDDEEDQDALEPDLDRDDSLKPMGSEIYGEDLLEKDYMLLSNGRYKPETTKNGHRSTTDELLTRPVTPGQKSTAKVPAEDTAVKNDIERPSTRSGSRPDSSADQPEASNTKEKQELRKSMKDMPPEYQQAFSSRPKIPRTPESRSFGASLGPLTSVRSNQKESVPKPTYSGNGPSSRPQSGGNQANSSSYY